MSARTMKMDEIRAYIGSERMMGASAASKRKECEEREDKGSPVGIEHEAAT